MVFISLLYSYVSELNFELILAAQKLMQWKTNMEVILISFYMIIKAASHGSSFFTLTNSSM